MVPEHSDNLKHWLIVSFEPCRVCGKLSLAHYIDDGQWCMCDSCLQAVVRRYSFPLSTYPLR
jgi:hypothetical protein